MMESLGPDFLKLLEIIWVNIILSGDNAVVIAMACRGLPADKQRMGMILGAGVAILLRVVFTILIVALLATPYLKIIGGVLLLWVAVKLIGGEEEGDSGIKESSKLWAAVQTIVIADAVMSLDNVLAIAAVAKDSKVLLIVGLAISIPLIIAGASLIINLLERFPLLVWAGAALLGWIAGEMIITDPAIESRIGTDLVHRWEIPSAILAALVVLAIGWFLSRRRHAVAGGV